MIAFIESIITLLVNLIFVDRLAQENEELKQKVQRIEQEKKEIAQAKQQLEQAYSRHTDTVGECATANLTQSLIKS